MKQLLVLVCVVLISASSCKKDNNDNQPVKTKREILSSGKWLISKSDAVVGQQGNPQNVNLYNDFMLPCQRDNYYLFNSDGSSTIDEGPSKCSDTSMQTVNTGTWELRENDSKLRFKVQMGIIDADVLADITELNDNTLTLKFDTTYVGMPATVTTSFTHIKQ